MVKKAPGRGRRCGFKTGLCHWRGGAWGKSFGFVFLFCKMKRCADITGSLSCRQMNKRRAHVLGSTADLRNSGLRRMQQGWLHGAGLLELLQDFKEAVRVLYYKRRKSR